VLKKLISCCQPVGEMLDPWQKHHGQILCQRDRAFVFNFAKLPFYSLPQNGLSWIISLLRIRNSCSKFSTWDDCNPVSITCSSSWFTLLRYLCVFDGFNALIDVQLLGAQLEDRNCARVDSSNQINTGLLMILHQSFKPEVAADSRFSCIQFLDQHGW